MLKVSIALGILNFSALAFAQTCTLIKTCTVEQKTWKDKLGWVTDLSKPFSLKPICAGETSQFFTIAPELGLEVSILNDSNPKLQLDLSSYKKTFVIASASGAVASEKLALSHRLKPLGKTIVSIDCIK